MKRIHKYKFDIREGVQEILTTHIGAIALTVNVIDDQAYIWIEHNDHYPIADEFQPTFKIRVIGTGWEFGDMIGPYIGTVFTGSFVWHIYRG